MITNRVTGDWFVHENIGIIISRSVSSKICNNIKLLKITVNAYIAALCVISGTPVISSDTLVWWDKLRLTPSLRNADTLAPGCNQNREISIYNDWLRCSQDPQQWNGLKSTRCYQKKKKKSLVNTAELRQAFLLRKNTPHHVVGDDGHYPRSVTPSVCDIITVLKRLGPFY